MGRLLRTRPRLPRPEARTSPIGSQISIRLRPPMRELARMQVPVVPEGPTILIARTTTGRPPVKARPQRLVDTARRAVRTEIRTPRSQVARRTRAAVSSGTAGLGLLCPARRLAGRCRRTTMAATLCLPRLNRKWEQRRGMQVSTSTGTPAALVVAPSQVHLTERSVWPRVGRATTAHRPCRPQGPAPRNRARCPRKRRLTVTIVRMHQAGDPVARATLTRANGRLSRPEPRPGSLPRCLPGTVIGLDRRLPSSQLAANSRTPARCPLVIPDLAPPAPTDNA
jgi:hypothetical protein